MGQKLPVKSVAIEKCFLLFDRVRSAAEKMKRLLDLAAEWAATLGGAKRPQLYIKAFFAPVNQERSHTFAWASRRFIHAGNDKNSGEIRQTRSADEVASLR